MTQSEARQFRILLVDDYDLVRQMLRKALKDIGLNQVAEAKDGKAALAILRAAMAENNPFDLVFCDWNMPEMSGMELLEYCRNSEEFKQLPFIMVTSEAEQKKVFKALNGGATDYVVKPFSSVTLEKKVTKILTKLMVGRADEKRSA